MQVSSLPDAGSREDWPIIAAILTRAKGPDEVFDPAIDVVWIAYVGSTIFGAATTRLRNDGIAELRLIGGSRFREWIGPLDEMVSAWARLCEAPKLISRGRRGWTRFNNAHGWVVASTDDENKTNFEKVL